MYRYDGALDTDSFGLAFILCIRLSRGYAHQQEGCRSPSCRGPVPSVSHRSEFMFSQYTSLLYANPETGAFPKSPSVGNRVPISLFIPTTQLSLMQSLVAANYGVIQSRPRRNPENILTILTPAENI
jgi:hypothetical protein